MLSILFEILISDNMQDGDASDMLSFYWSIKKWSKLGQKADILLIFKVFFVYAPLLPMSYAPRFCRMKGLIKIYICGKFHQYSIFVVVKLKIFEVFRTD